MNVLVIGGTLFIGRLLVDELLKAGHHVAVLHRGSKHDFPKRVENLMADRNDPAAVREAIGRRRFEVVFDNVYDPKHGTTAAHVEGTVQAVEKHVQRYVFMSSVAAYGDGLNHYENDPLAPDNHPLAFVRNKAMAERMLFRLHHQRRFPVVTFRPAFIYGPGNPWYREAFFWDRLRAGRPIIIPGDGHRLMQFVYVKDLVAACLAAMMHPGSAGEAFNLGNTRPLTQVEFAQTLAAAAGKDANLMRVPRDLIQQVGGNPSGPPMYFGEHLDLPPITMNVTKVTRMLGVRPTPLEAGFKQTYAWYLRNNRRAQPDYAFEDRLIALAAATPRVEAQS